jgi:hypothetical protein
VYSAAASRIFVWCEDQLLQEEKGIAPRSYVRSTRRRGSRAGSGCEESVLENTFESPLVSQERRYAGRGSQPIIVFFIVDEIHGLVKDGEELFQPCRVLNRAAFLLLLLLLLQLRDLGPSER